MRLPKIATLLLVCLGAVSSCFMEETNNGTTLVIAAEQSVQINSNLVVNGSVTVNSVDLMAKIEELQNTIAALNASLMGCAPIPCLNGGSCHLGVCSCSAGFTGNQCESIVLVDVCAFSPCTNGGSCSLGVCTCAVGFTGSVCQSDVNQCASSPCLNGGSCSQSNNTNLFVCSCAAGFTGVGCKSNIPNVCLSTPCSNGGVCSPSVDGTFTCQCTFGFSGPTCGQFNLTSIQWGTSGADTAQSIAIDSSKSVGYIAGQTSGAFPGFINFGSNDLFMRTVDLASGSVIRTTQWGTNSYEYVLYFVIDSSKALGYITGYTGGSFPGFTNLGSNDVFMCTVNLTSGAVVRTTQWGTNGDDVSFSIAIDSSKSVGYITGYTSGAFFGFSFLGGAYDAFMSTLNLTSGAVVRTIQWGTSGIDYPQCIAIDSTKSIGCITGYTTGTFPGFTNLGNQDVFMSTVDLTSGAVVRTTQWGTSNADGGLSVAIDSSKSLGYITGTTTGAFSGFINPNGYNLGYNDVFMSTVSLTSGAVVRTTQWGTNNIDLPFSIAIDSSKSVGYILGTTGGAFSGFTFFGGSWDVFMSTVNLTSGAVIRTTQWGTNGDDRVGSIAIDSIKSVGYISGTTNGAFPGFTLNGTQDAFMSVTSLTDP